MWEGKWSRKVASAGLMEEQKGIAAAATAGSWYCCIYSARVHHKHLAFAINPTAAAPCCLQYFDYFHCIDKCAAPLIFAKLN